MRPSTRRRHPGREVASAKSSKMAGRSNGARRGPFVSRSLVVAESLILCISLFSINLFYDTIYRIDSPEVTPRATPIPLAGPKPTSRRAPGKGPHEGNHHHGPPSFLPPLPLHDDGFVERGEGPEGDEGGDDDGDGQIYCYCHRVSFGEMIGCDGSECEREWVSPKFFRKPSFSTWHLIVGQHYPAFIVARCSSLAIVTSHLLSELRFLLTIIFFSFSRLLPSFSIRSRFVLAFFPLVPSRLRWLVVDPEGPMVLRRVQGTSS